MGSRNIVGIVLQFIIYIAIQLVLFRNVVVFQTAFCYVYVAAILLLPVEIGKITQLIIGLLAGLAVDIFYDTLGVHTAATVLLAYVRIVVLNYLQPSTGYEAGTKPLVRELGVSWFASYAIPLLFIHHLTFFAIEISDFSRFGSTIFKTVGTTVFTFLIILVIQLIFYPKQRRR